MYVGRNPAAGALAGGEELGENRIAGAMGDAV